MPWIHRGLNLPHKGNSCEKGSTIARDVTQGRSARGVGGGVGEFIANLDILDWVHDENAI